MRVKPDACREIEKTLDVCRLNWFTGNVGSTDLNQKADDKKEYYAYVNTLLKNLTNFSLYLKTKPIEQRKEMLKILLRKMNNELKERRNVGNSVFYQGVYLPFSSDIESNPANFVS